LSPRRAHVQRSSQMLLACLVLQLSTSACGKTPANDGTPAATMRDEDADAAANSGGSEQVDAGNPSRGAKQDAAAPESDAGAVTGIATDAGAANENQTENGNEGKTPSI